MLMVRPHEKNDQDGLSLETLVSSIALSPIVGRKRPDRCRRASRRSMSPFWIGSPPRRGVWASVLLLTLIRHHTVPPFGRTGAADSW